MYAIPPIKAKEEMQGAQGPPKNLQKNRSKLTGFFHKSKIVTAIGPIKTNKVKKFRAPKNCHIFLCQKDLIALLFRF